ncbi:MAG: hypothetical protein AAF990_02375 [Bacteroidota bacterium]
MKIKKHIQQLPVYLVFSLIALLCWRYIARFSTVRKPSSAWTRSGSPRKDSLTAERHFGYIAEDKFLELLQNLKRVECRFEIDDSQTRFLTITKANNCFEEEFEELFFNAYPMQVFLAMPNNPIQIVDGGSGYQFRIPRKTIEGRAYVLLPYDLLMGVFQALGGNQNISKSLLVKN